jgi:PadR family transcriptional regulator, regulatory protein PadR
MAHGARVGAGLKTPASELRRGRSLTCALVRDDGERQKQRQKQILRPLRGLIMTHGWRACLYPGTCGKNGTGGRRYYCTREVYIGRVHFMTSPVRVSKQTLKLLAALSAKPTSWHYGYALSRETELQSGTLYPILMRLEERGWLETQWEQPQSGTGKWGGRPPRHMYRLTASGHKAAVEAISAARSRALVRKTKTRRPVLAAIGVKGA